MPDGKAAVHCVDHFGSSMASRARQPREGGHSEGEKTKEEAKKKEKKGREERNKKGKGEKEWGQEGMGVGEGGTCSSQLNCFKRWRALSYRAGIVRADQVEESIAFGATCEREKPYSAWRSAN